MSNWQTILHIREKAARARQKGAGPGPFITLSRQYGCSGMTLGLLLADLLNEQAPPGRGWHVFGKEILHQLADESEIAETLVDELRTRKPAVLSDFLRSFSGAKMPSGFEVRHRITAIIRGLAYDGYNIIVGQGAAGAAADIGNGISIRIEAPLDWRAERVCKSEGMTPAQARLKIRRRDKEREYLRKIYAMKYPREPAFDIVYDNSHFTAPDLAQHIVYMMKLKRMI